MSETDELREYYADQIAAAAERRLAVLHAENARKSPLKPCSNCGAKVTPKRSETTPKAVSE